jgi:myo-inositol-1(or 4)-monophosphatase
VTSLDIWINEFFKKINNSYSVPFEFVSEEEMNSVNLGKFPQIVLDPIDGTKELASNIPECAISFGIYNSNNIEDGIGFSWIYNPFTLLELDSEKVKLFNSTNNQRSRVKSGLYRKKIIGISRTEFNEPEDRNKIIEYLNSINDPNDYELQVIGSIAYKLLLMSYNIIDEVVTCRPKSLWDIRAGSHLLAIKGKKLICNKKIITNLSNISYKPILHWC